jgi:hypothetical protein
MSITYRGIIGNKARVTLPSVEAWGTNNNILRDPPKSIMTRRIDKVNQDGSLNEMYYHSGDRFAEHVNVYARGVNPMVSVEYGNNNSFGMSKNNGNNFYGAGKLPYRIMQGGAFHPPLLRQEQLLPLSRLPRNVTFVQTNKESIDYAKSAICNQQPKEHRQIVKNKIEGFITPTKSMKLETPIKEHFVVNYINENPLMYDYNTNLRANGDTPHYVEEKNLERNMPLYQTTAQKSINYATLVRPDKEIFLEINTPIHDVIANKSINIATNGVIDNTIELIKNMPTYQVRDTKIRNTGVNAVYNPDSIELTDNLPHYLISDRKIRNVGTNGILNDHIELTENVPHHMIANSKGYNRGDRIIINDEINLSENTPHYNFQVNKGDKRVQFQNKYENKLQFDHKTPHIMLQSTKTQNIKTEAPTTDFNRLHDMINPGSMEGRVIIPTSERNSTYNSNYTTNKRELAQKIMRERHFS